MKHRQHTPPAGPPCAVDVQPPTRHTVRPNSGCSAGGDNTRLTGSQPASVRKRRIQPAGQLRGRPGQCHPGQHVLEPDRFRRRIDSRRRGRAGHRVTPAACSRGLGTRSTAARNRPGSGCRYTCEEDTEA